MIRSFICDCNNHFPFRFFHKSGDIFIDNSSETLTVESYSKIRISLSLRPILISGEAEGSALRASLGMTSRVSFGTLRKGTREAVRATYCNDMPQSAAY